MKSIGRRNGLGAAAIAVLALLAAGSGCKDQLAGPTRGFLEVSSGDVFGVEVFVDGVSKGVTSRVGPIDAGVHTVSVAKLGYGSDPGEVAVEVPAGGTEAVAFTLQLLDWGQIRVTATDEVLGTEVTGAEVLLDLGGGLMPTGKFTPVVLDTIPLGPAAVAVRRAGFQDSPPRNVTVDRFTVADEDLTLSPPHAVLAEMTTWTTCSGCPQSADKLHEMQQANPDHLYVIEWHRRGPGWPLYHAPSLNREALYGTGGVAPAVVFQGGSDASQGPAVLIGSEAATLLEYENRFEEYLGTCGTDCAMAIRVQGEFGPAPTDSVRADVHVLYRGGGVPSGLVLWIVLSEDQIPQSYVGGNTAQFSYVARKSIEIPVAFTTPGEVQRFEHAFAVDDADWFPAAYDPPNNFHLTAWVQSGGTGVSGTHEILAVGGL